ncbi:hypothetical protein ACIBL8_45960 [Streptomyces sp. NPDC050523]|uniref:hypothetical protein n=1 Tax=Streptomyces sp. NPDC050523 TaxID=3365622 RepID=UPI0037972051
MHTPYEPTEVPAWPVYTLTVQDNGHVTTSGPLTPASEHPTRASAIDAVAAAAARLRRPVRAEATEPDGTVWHLVVSPEGAVGELSARGQRAKAPKKRHDKAGDQPRDMDAEQAPAEAAPDPIGPALTSDRPALTPDRPVPPADRSVASASCTDALARIDEHAAAGRVDQAVTLAARLDEQAAQTMGVSHPDALRIREARAHVTALAGDAVGGVRLYRDVAERWHYRGCVEQAEAVAACAHALWLRITDPDTAVSAGIVMLRIRNQIPGEQGSALAATLKRQERLEAARNYRWNRPKNTEAMQ